jgi:ABC-type dipeptide transport system, periplasmic component
MRATAVLLALALAATARTASGAMIEPPMLLPQVEAGTLPPVAARIPAEPEVVDMSADGRSPGRYGGLLRMLMSQPKDTRMMVVYGYARLVGYDARWTIVPDLLEHIDVDEGRVFTLHLRKGHRWSDGHPFTSEDFRFFWEDVANNKKLSPGGPERFLIAGGKPPRVEFLDETTIRYSWDSPNPFFLPALAGARPDFIFLPAHYLKQFHSAYTPADVLEARAKEEGARNWAALFTMKAQAYKNDNPDLPSLEPWVLRTKPPSSRFVFERNPYYHRIDTEGHQLPYIDEVAMTIVSAALIPAKVAAGDADLQARGLTFENYTILKQGEGRGGFRVRLWQSARGSELALYPNLNANDPAWRELVRDVRFRRALSMAINRHEINEVIFYGLAEEGNDTVLPQSPLFKPIYADAFAGYDPAAAARLLDEIGLPRRGADGIRRLTDGRVLQLVAETAGEDPTQVAILQLIRDSLFDVGIQLLIKPEQRELLRNRVFSGEAVLSVWYGLENGLATPSLSPQELAPTNQQQLNWPKWGQNFESGGRSGEAPDMQEAKRLLALNADWTRAARVDEQTAIWHEMLAIRADQAFSIGTVRGVPQPVVVNTRLRNVPEKGLYNWEPGAHFGVYHPDSFWFEEPPEPPPPVAGSPNNVPIPGP